MSRDASCSQTVGGRDRPRLLIAGHFGFPNGTGAAARVHAYAKGLRAAGWDVTVVCLRWSEPSVEGAKNRLADGRYDGIPFAYSSGSPFRPPTYVRRRLRDALSALRFARLARGSHGQRPASIILFGGAAVWIPLTAAVCRLAGSACVVEINEYPFVYAPDTMGTRIRARAFARAIHLLVDGVIVISTCLEQYSQRHVRRGARVLRVPILVDLEEFRLPPVDAATDRCLLGYVGNLDHPGEVNGLIDAFGEVAAHFPQWSLRIIGGSDDLRAHDGFRTRAAGLGLEGRVEFMGSVNRADLPRVLSDVAAFALPRASGLFSSAGLPTKLAEYLATARPVVVTATGDVSIYLKDGVNAYLVPPDDTQAFAARLAELFVDPLAAHDIGARGRETAQREFDVMSQGRRLAAFMEGFSGDRR